MSNVPNHLSVSNIRISSFDYFLHVFFLLGPVGRFLEDAGPVNQRWWLHDSLEDCVRRYSRVSRLFNVQELCPPGRFANKTGTKTCLSCELGRYAPSPGSIVCSGESLYTKPPLVDLFVTRSRRTRLLC